MIASFLNPLVIAFKECWEETSRRRWSECIRQLWPLWWPGGGNARAQNIDVCSDMGAECRQELGMKEWKKYLSSMKHPYLISRRPLQEILHDSMVSKAFIVGSNHVSDCWASVKDGWVVFEGPTAFMEKNPMAWDALDCQWLCARYGRETWQITRSSLVDWSSSSKTFRILHGRQVAPSMAQRDKTGPIHRRRTTAAW